MKKQEEPTWAEITAKFNQIAKMQKETSKQMRETDNKNYKIYLCLASFRFSKIIREKADEKGIVLIQQKGDKNEVISKTIKAWL